MLLGYAAPSSQGPPDRAYDNEVAIHSLLSARPAPPRPSLNTSASSAAPAIGPSPPGRHDASAQQRLISTKSQVTSPVSALSYVASIRGRTLLLGGVGQAASRRASPSVRRTPRPFKNFGRLTSCRRKIIDKRRAAPALRGRALTGTAEPSACNKGVSRRGEGHSGVSAAMPNRPGRALDIGADRSRAHRALTKRPRPLDAHAQQSRGSSQSAVTRGPSTTSYVASAESTTFLHGGRPGSARATRSRRGFRRPPNLSWRASRGGAGVA